MAASNAQSQAGLVVVLSAPSGAGKRTLLGRLRELEDGIATTVSATTRAPRPGEVAGVDYHFLDREAFEARLVAGDFVEHAEVHGNLYGTLREELERHTQRGQSVVLELDVQGMRSLRKLIPDAITVFLLPPSMEELERRLRHRGANDEDDIALRLRNAREEMAAAHEFDHRVVNDDVDRAAQELADILRNRRHSASSEE